MDSRNLPVASGAVFPGGSRSHAAPPAGCIAPLLHAFERFDVPQPQALETRELEAPAGASDIPECVASLVPVSRGVGRRTDADTIEDYDCRALQFDPPA
jgi:hypothetical protein